MRQIKPIIWWAWGILVVMGIYWRITGLSQTPPGLYIDEASIGENAYQIWKTGKDEWGEKWPVFFKAFGEYKNPIFIYSVAAGFSILGVSVETLRLTAAMWGLATVAMTGLTVAQISKSKATGAVIGLILLFLPWHFHSSRVAFEAITMPFFMSLMIYGWVKKRLWLTYASIGGMFYSYTSARLFAPMFATYLVLSSLNKTNFKKHLVGMGILGLCWLPAIGWEQSHPGSLTARYTTVRAKQTSIVKTYVNQFGPDLWFGKGDSNLRHTPKKGLVPKVLIPLLIIGLFQCVKLIKNSAEARLIGLCLATAPAAAALTTTAPNGLRMIHVIPVLMIIIGYGVKYLSQSKFRIILAGILILWGVETGVFLNNYFKRYATEAGWWYDTPFVEVLPALWKINQPVVVHHYLIGKDHQVTQNFICRTRPDCRMIAISPYRGQTDSNLNANHLYFDADCLNNRLKMEMISDRACIRKN